MITSTDTPIYLYRCIDLIYLSLLNFEIRKKNLLTWYGFDTWSGLSSAHSKFGSTLFSSKKNIGISFTCDVKLYPVKKKYLIYATKEKQYNFRLFFLFFNESFYEFNYQIELLRKLTERY